MSEPTYYEARAEGYQLAKEIFILEEGRDPTQQEWDEMYEALCDKYSY